GDRVLREGGVRQGPRVLRQGPPDPTEVRDRVEQQGRGPRTDESVRGGEPLPREGDELPSHLRCRVAQPWRGPRPTRGAGGGAAVPREGPVDLPRRRGPGYDSDVKASPRAAWWRASRAHL